MLTNAVISTIVSLLFIPIVFFRWHIEPPSKMTLFKQLLLHLPPLRSSRLSEVPNIQIPFISRIQLNTNCLLLLQSRSREEKSHRLTSSCPLLQKPIACYKNLLPLENGTKYRNTEFVVSMSAKLVEAKSGDLINIICTVSSGGWEFRMEVRSSWPVIHKR